MKYLLKNLSLLLFALLFVSGCATNRGVIELKAPKAESVTKSNGKSIFIRSVVDHRSFEQAPKKPNIPSLGFEGVDGATDLVKKRAIARKRNSFGKALGDILLKENQNVESVIYNVLQSSFTELGYEVISNKENVQKDTIIVDVTINKFWSWMNPGFWSLTLTSEIGTSMSLDNFYDKQKQIYIQSQGSFQTASESNWVEVMQKSLQHYSDKVKEYFAVK